MFGVPVVAGVGVIFEGGAGADRSAYTVPLLLRRFVHRVGEFFGDLESDGVGHGLAFDTDAGLQKDPIYPAPNPKIDRTRLNVMACGPAG